jgi:hypothetical protein
VSSFFVFLVVAALFAVLAWVGWERRDPEFAEDDRPMFIGIALALLAVAILVGLVLRAVLGTPETVPARFAHIFAMVGTARLSLPVVRKTLRWLIER